MDIFKSIDDKLNEFAKNHNGRMSGREIFQSVRKDGREQRKIVWEDEMFVKAILIFPAALNDNGWDFIIDASLVDNGDVTGEIPFWTKDLLEGVPFPEIEKQIDYLLAESEKLLSAVKVEDMRFDWTYLDGKLVDIRIK